MFKSYSFVLIALLFGLSTLIVQAQPDQRLNFLAIEQLNQTPKSEYQFVVTGDNRDGDQIFLKILQQAQAYNPAFLLHTGDFVKQGGHDEYQRFMGYLKLAPYPIIPALGNHDAYQQGRKWYNQYFGPSYYSFDYGQDRFVFVDNASGSISAEQLKWLEQQLQVKRRHKFLAMHMPPMNIVWFHAFQGPSADAMVKLAEKYQVSHVFFGHIHIYDKKVSRGVKYIVSGGAGAPLFRMPLYFSAEGGAFNHFVVIKVSEQGVQEEVVRLNKK